MRGKIIIRTRAKEILDLFGEVQEIPIIKEVEPNPGTMKALRRIEERFNFAGYGDVFKAFYDSLNKQISHERYY